MLTAFLDTFFSTPVGLLRMLVEGVSFTGISARFTSSIKGSLAGSLLQLFGITLNVCPVAVIPKRRKMVIRSRVENIEAGEDRWHTLHDARWQRSQS